MLLINIILSILSYIINIYMVLLVIAAVLSFVGANSSNAIVTVVNAITKPPCRWLAKKYPSLIIKTENGYFDLSSLVLIVILGCVLIVINKVEFYLFYQIPTFK